MSNLFKTSFIQGSEGESEAELNVPNPILQGLLVVSDY